MLARIMVLEIKIWPLVGTWAMDRAKANKENGEGIMKTTVTVSKMATWIIGQEVETLDIQT